MKKETHPDWYPDAKVMVNGEVVMTVGSTQPELNVEIWSGTHPFYTGQQRMLDSEGQVDRFLKRLQKREELQSSLEGEEEETVSPLEWLIDQIDELDSRAMKGLNEAALNTVADVLAKFQEGDDNLLSITGVGQMALINIKKFLRRHDLIQ